MPTVGEEQKKPPILELGDVRLRPLRTSDAPALLAYLSDPRVIEHTSIPIATPESVAAAVARDMAAYRERSSFRLALASSDDRLIGICGFNTWSSVHRHAELAYELAPDYWGRGYMRAAVRALPKNFHVFALLAQDFALNEVGASPNQAMQRTAR